jgi:hypothetical protein
VAQTCCRIDVYQETPESVLAANLEREKASSSSSSSSVPKAPDLPSSLGGCLLAGCGLGSLSLQEAQQVWQAWEHAAAEVSQKHDERAEDTDWLVALRGLALKWQQPPGLTKLNTKQQAVVNQLRGLVQLATASATLGAPVHEVLQVSY